MTSAGRILPTMIISLATTLFRVMIEYNTEYLLHNLYCAMQIKEHLLLTSLSLRGKAVGLAHKECSICTEAKYEYFQHHFRY